ncbi:MAG: EscU/YscU/HrcU family type III secretion system export apparatus switch protein [Spirochaetota bacterium]
MKYGKKSLHLCLLCLITLLMLSHNEKAAALHYTPGESAPVVVSTARGALVQEMLKIAERYNVPVYKNAVLADVLSGKDPGTAVPEPLFSAVAEVFAFCLKTDRRLREKLGR